MCVCDGFFVCMYVWGGVCMCVRGDGFFGVCVGGEGVVVADVFFFCYLQYNISTIFSIVYAQSSVYVCLYVCVQVQHTICAPLQEPYVHRSLQLLQSEI